MFSLFCYTFFLLDEGYFLSEIQVIFLLDEGYITFPELEKMMAGQRVEIDYEEEMLRAKFNEFDLDGDGSITKKELKTVLRSMGCDMPEAEAEAMIQEADKNGDGVISFDGMYKITSQTTKIVCFA